MSRIFAAMAMAFLRIQSLSSEFLGLKTVMEDGTSQNERDRSHFMQVFRRFLLPAV